MKRSCLVCFVLLAGLCWAARPPREPWSRDLERALTGDRPVVTLVAAPGRPQSEATCRALDEAWDALDPHAERVVLECSSPRLGRESALAVFVFAPGGSLVARRDGPIDALSAEEWLREALDAASSAGSRAVAGSRDTQVRFVNAELALRLGDTEHAEREFSLLTKSADPGILAAAHERLARLEIDRGEVARAREQFALARTGTPTRATSARMLLTRGLIEFAERNHREAWASLREARSALRAADHHEADRASFELARAQAACGEGSRAVATLDELCHGSTSRALCGRARQFAAGLFAPPTSH